MSQIIKQVPLLIVGITVILLFGTRPCLAQQPTTDEVVRINTDLVVLDALVIDKKTGHPVRDLKKNDFELYVDGVKQEISHFSQDELPLSVLLLLDVSNSVAPIIKEIGESARNALENLKPGDEVAVMAFAGRSKLAQGFTKNRQLVSDKIIEASRTDSLGGGTFLKDALRAAATEMNNASNPVSRRVIIVVTDNVSSQFGTDKHLTIDLLEAGTVVYGLIVRGGIGKVMNLLTVGALHGVDPYSEATGGEVMGAKKNEVDAGLAKVIGHLRARYSLGFKPTNTTDDGVLHRIKLQLSSATLKQKGKLVVKTRNGYYFRRRSSS
jgi:VWFA-related protein